MSITYQDLVRIWGDPINKSNFDLNNKIGTVFTDTRKQYRDGFFIPLKGDKYDGHDYLTQAYENGIRKTIVSIDYSFNLPEDFLYWKVTDTLHAYQQIAKLYRESYKIPLIAVTGSAGKTTTKELIKSSLSELGNIHTSPYNYNNDIGLPFTLTGLNSKHSAVVVELAMRGLGEISRLSKICKPDIAIITNIGHAHIGRLHTRRNIAIAKCEIIDGLSSEGVVIIPNGDLLLYEVLREKWQGRIIRVSILESSLNHIEKDFNPNTPSDVLGIYNPLSNQLSVQNATFNLSLEGKHNALNFLFAYAVIKELQISEKNLNNLTLNNLAGRGASITVGGINILDESYNASPESVLATLDLLVSKKGRHFAVLGTMLELGEQSLYFHKLIADRVIKLNLDGIIFISDGREQEAFNHLYECLTHVAIVNSKEKAIPILLSWLKSGDNILVKGSRKLGLDELIPILSRELVKPY